MSGFAVIPWLLTILWPHNLIRSSLSPTAPSL